MNEGLQSIYHQIVLENHLGQQNFHQQGQQQVNNDPVQRILNDPSASDWLKSAINALLQRDIVDAYRDVGILNHLIGKRYMQNYMDTAKKKGAVPL